MLQHAETHGETNLCGNNPVCFSLLTILGVINCYCWCPHQSVYVGSPFLSVCMRVLLIYVQQVHKSEKESKSEGCSDSLSSKPLTLLASYLSNSCANDDRAWWKELIKRRGKVTSPSKKNNAVVWMVQHEKTWMPSTTNRQTCWGHLGWTLIWKQTKSPVLSGFLCMMLP